MAVTNCSEITPAALKQLVYGACFCASGGGGPIAMAINFLHKIQQSLPLVPINTLAEGKKVLILADMGSPEAAAQGRGYTAPVNAFYVLEDYLRRQDLGEAAYLMPIEIGAVNSLIPFYIASQLGTALPVVDADPSGRSVPQLNETLLDLSGTAICPAAVASDTIDSDGDSGTGVPHCHHTVFGDVHTSATQLEREARDVVSEPQYHQVGGLACYPLDSDWLKGHGGESALVSESLSAAIAVGEVVLDYAAQGYRQLEPALKKVLDAQDRANYILARGTLTTIDNRTHDGFDVGRLTFTRDDGSELWVYYKNESLLAWDPVRSKPLAIGPDCINLLLTSAHGHFGQCTPLSTADISERMDIAIWGASCAKRMRNATIERFFLKDIHQILAAYPEDPVSVTHYQTIESLND